MITGIIFSWWLFGTVFHALEHLQTNDLHLFDLVTAFVIGGILGPTSLIIDYCAKLNIVIIKHRKRNKQ